MHLDSSITAVAAVGIPSLVAHECAHGWAALWRGDPTARERGRLSLDPLKQLDPLGSLAVPFGLAAIHSPLLFGWARPIPVDHGRLARPRRDAVVVALAGPAANLLLAIGFAALARAIPQGASGLPLHALMSAGVAWNCALAMFNLIPIPPLDGSWVLMHFLKLRHIVALHHFRAVALALTVALASLPPSRWLFEASLHGAIGTCFGLFGLSPNGGLR
jgi:Zn-dependent protease